MAEGVARNLLELEMPDCKNVDDDAMMALARCCGRLSRLNISGLFLISDEALVEVATRCRRLEFVMCEGCYSISRIGLAAADTMLRMAQESRLSYALLPRARIEINCLKRRQEESRAAHLLQKLVGCVCGSRFCVASAVAFGHFERRLVVVALRVHLSLQCRTVPGVPHPHRVCGRTGGNDAQT